jgi:exosortase
MLSRTDRTLVAVAAAGVVAVYGPTIAWLWERWTLSVWHNAHGLLVPFVVAVLVWNALARTRPAARPSAWGFAFVVPALLLHILDTAMHTQLLSAASIVVLLPGVSLLLLGVEATRAIAFPLAFLTLALPIPLSMTETLHLVLRHVSATATAAVVPFLGVPVYLEGTMLHMANADLLIGDACSGFSTLYAAAALACLTAYQANGWKQRTLVLASAAPLAIAANVLRIVLLVVVVDRTGIDVLETWIHPASGMLTFALALPVIFWLGRPRDDAQPPGQPRVAPVAASEVAP